MQTTIKLIPFAFCLSSLTGCVTDAPMAPPPSETYVYQSPWVYSIHDKSFNYQEPTEPREPMSVPTIQHPPTPHHDMDRDWVKNQNAENYTIQVADDEKPALVAGTLYKTPKQERTAEVKILQNGKTSYKGLYGSYPNLDSALQAMKTLPPEVKQSANIKTWGSVQREITE